MKQKLLEIIRQKQNNGVLFVLKGLSVEWLGLEKVSLERTVSNKIGRLMEITTMSPSAISFDEFVCLYQLILLQFQEIFIIENPLYWNYYPIGVTLGNNILTQLIGHFDEDAAEDVAVTEVDEYSQVYSNLFMTDSGAVCCYNQENWELDSPKIIRHALHIPKASLIIASNEDITVSRTLCDSKDYLQMLLNVEHTEDIIAFSIDAFYGDLDGLRSRLEMLNALYPNRLFLIKKAAPVPIAASNPKLLALLQKYRPGSDFRDIKVYDVTALEDGIKRIQTISQEQIISDLIEQAENAMHREQFQDIFVTAPTGSGKSLMFQLPAIYLAEQYGLVTLVVTPLIGLMNDQVQQLADAGYYGARTINSDISPLVKQDILDEVANGTCHILYLSPESLLSRSDVEQLIGHRQIGLVVVDEAHIVTTWGKQFRPDYWYLGDHVRKLRRAQMKKEDMAAPFVLATFTATAIYRGVEDMYQETVNSLHMIDPITYLGYVRRDNISIEISEIPEKKGKTEYELNKFDDLIDQINTALMRGQKTLIYFPTVALINRFWAYCGTKSIGEYVSRYHGQLDAVEKNEAFEKFRNGQAPVMLATKAFGMGIDVPDIAVVIHFAPTGNVCDYMQEIGRAARTVAIEGHAVYHHMRNDFKHINRLHGLSTIRPYQLVEVIKKVLELYQQQRMEDRSQTTRKRNEMLVDADCFSYLFENGQSDAADLTNKVKTAMLLIQKDYENRGFAPFTVRPIPLFVFGFFSISSKVRDSLSRQYGNCWELVYEPDSVCKVNLRRIWEKTYKMQMSFPKFKYLLYTKSPELSFNSRYELTPAISAEIYFEENFGDTVATCTKALKAIVNQSVTKGTYLSLSQMVEMLASFSGMSRFKAENLINVVIAAMNAYRKSYASGMNTELFRVNLKKNESTYMFLPATNSFFNWLQRETRLTTSNIKDGKLYIVNTRDGKRGREVTTVLGVLEAFGSLRFKSLGGSNSQLYIYVYETKNMLMVREKPYKYQNRLLETVNTRHKISVQMLSFLYQSGFSSEEIWNHLENYFLGILPPQLSNTQTALSDLPQED